MNTHQSQENNPVLEHFKNLGYVSVNRSGSMEVLRPPYGAPIDALPILLIKKEDNSVLGIITDANAVTHRLYLSADDALNFFVSEESPFITREKLV